MATRPSRNISLTAELDGFIDAELASGDYGNASEVVRTARKLLRERGEAGRPPVPRGGFPIGGGECGRLIRERDWSATPLGPVDDWSEALRTTVSNIVNSPVPKVLMWGAEHVMLYNDGYIAIAGAHHPQAMGGRVAEVWPEIWDWNRAILDRGMAGEIVAYHDQPLTLNRDGQSPETLQFDLFYTPIFQRDGTVGGVMCTVIDNTARVAAESAATASATELRTITDALPVLVSYVDRDGIYRFANRFYEEWFGTPPEGIIGRHLRAVIGEDTYAERLPLIERALAGEAIVSEGTLPHRDGTLRRAEIRYLPRVAADGTIAGFHVLATDVEERSRREAAIRVSNERFRAAMEAVHGVLWTNTADGRMEGPQPGWQALTCQPGCGPSIRPDA